MSARDPSIGSALPMLLGPAGPEVTCEQCFELLDVYVDTRIAGADAERALPGMREHLEGCPACAEEFQSLLELAAPPLPAGRQPG